MKTVYTIISLVLVSFLSSAQPNIPLPDAPDLSVTWQDDAMHLSVSNLNPISNNYVQSYAAFDSNIIEGDSIWYFQGYQIYQVQIPFDYFDAYDTDIARLVAQTDVDDDLSSLYNSFINPETEDCVTFEEVNGANGGLASEFVVSSEMWTGEFTPGEFYCYVAVAYVANANGVSESCPDMPYQYYPGVFSAEGDMLIQCATVQEPTNVDENQELTAEIFPNPTSDILHWDTPSEVTSVRLMSILGEEILSVDENADKMDLSSLPPGMYLIEMVSGDQKLIERVLKQ